MSRWRRPRSPLESAHSDVTGAVVAAISIGVPLARCGVVALRRQAPVIVEAAEAASRRLGWSPETLPSENRKEGRP
jgi:hypothetical protein